MRASLIRASSIRRAISCRRRLFSAFSRILVLMLLAATLRAKVTEKWAKEIGDSQLPQVAGVEPGEPERPGKAGAARRAATVRSRPPPARGHAPLRYAQSGDPS